MWEFVQQCQAWLAQSPKAMSYLVDVRHLTPKAIADAKIGYYPESESFPQRPGYPRELGCLKGRIVVPILSEFGKVVVACAGRPPDPKAKGAWWNTARQGLKSSHLYGLSEARTEMFRRNKAYVFEGYMDRIVLSQHGLPNGVAAMSTSVGIRRLGLIARYCDRVCLCFDADKNDSGQLGTLRTLADMETIGVGVFPWRVTMIQLPKGEDPDDFVHRHGLAAFLSLERPVERKLLETAEQAYELLKLRIWDRKRRAEKEQA